jgi:hypothetical protein
MKIGLALVVCLFSMALHASQRAVTDEGDIVILNDDGTWHFDDPTMVEAEEIPTNEQPFVKPDNASFKLKSTRNNSEVWLNAKKWAFEKSKSNDAAEYSFVLKGKDLYGMFITEQIEIGMESLTQIALENARAGAPNMKVTEKEYRNVNGVSVIYMEMEGTLQGTSFTYLGYYYSNETGTTQFITYTGTSLVKKYKSEIEDFLNGFSIL